MCMKEKPRKISPNKKVSQIENMRLKMSPSFTERLRRITDVISTSLLTRAKLKTSYEISYLHDEEDGSVSFLHEADWSRVCDTHHNSGATPIRNSPMNREDYTIFYRPTRSHPSDWVVELMSSEHNEHIAISARDVTNFAWSTKMRKSSKIGRIIRKLFPHGSDSQIETFVNKWKGTYKRTNWELVSGKSIAEFYSEDSYDYDVNIGTLAASCMRSVPSNWFNLYTNNPDIVSMLILYSSTREDLIVGRALVWKLPDNITLMDRIYGTSDTMEVFINYAKLNRWWYKAKQTYSAKRLFYTPENDYRGEVRRTLKLTLPEGSWDYVPYLDTFTFASKDYKLLSNQALKETPRDLSGIEGRCKFAGEYCVDIKERHVGGKYVSRRDAFYRNVVLLSNGENAPVDHTVREAITREYMWEEDCERIGLNYYRKNSIFLIPLKTRKVFINQAVLINGEFASYSDVADNTFDDETTSPKMSKHSTYVYYSEELNYETYNNLIFNEDGTPCTMAS